jgi:hypothetical protein
VNESYIGISRHRAAKVYRLMPNSECKGAAAFSNFDRTQLLVTSPSGVLPKLEIEFLLIRLT